MTCNTLCDSDPNFSGPCDSCDEPACTNYASEHTSGPLGHYCGKALSSQYLQQARFDPHELRPDNNSYATMNVTFYVHNEAMAGDELIGCDLEAYTYSTESHQLAVAGLAQAEDCMGRIFTSRFGASSTDLAAYHIAFDGLTNTVSYRVGNYSTTLHHLPAWKGANCLDA